MFTDGVYSCQLNTADASIVSKLVLTEGRPPGQRPSLSHAAIGKKTKGAKTPPYCGGLEQASEANRRRRYEGKQTAIKNKGG